MALIAIASDKGAPGVTTTALALAAVWPRPVLLAECDPAGGDLAYRLPAEGGGRIDPRRGLLSLAVAARRGLQPHQAWEHTQKLNGGLDILTGVTSAEQGAGLNLLWGPVGRVLAANAQADVIADCGRLGVDGPHYDLLAEAALVVLVTRASLGEVIRLRDRAAAVAAAIQKRGRPGTNVDVVVVADYKHFRSAVGEIGQVLAQAKVPARVVGGLADDSKGADLLRGEWGGKLDKSLLIRTARDVAENLAGRLPTLPQAGAPRGAGAHGGPGGPGARAGDKPRGAAAEPYVSPSTWAAPPRPGAPGTPQQPGAYQQPARAGYPVPPGPPGPSGPATPDGGYGLPVVAHEPAGHERAGQERAVRGRHSGEPSAEQRGR